MEKVLSHEMQEKLGHYISEEWKKKISEITSLPIGCFTFAVQSDTHFSVNSKENHANNLKALSHFIPLKFYANLGDYIKGYFMNEIGKIENTPDKTINANPYIPTEEVTVTNCGNLEFIVPPTPQFKDTVVYIDGVLQKKKS